MPAFERAVSLGYTYLETDAHVTTDGVVLAFHDDDLSRTCGRPGRISELPWSEVSTARVDGIEPIPKLADVFDAFPTARVNVDCKSSGVVGPLGDVLAAEPGRLDRTCVGSFESRRLRRIRQRFGSRLCTSYGTGELVLLRVGAIAPGGPLAVQVPVRSYGVPIVTPKFVRRCHRHGLPVHVWTIDDQAEMSRLLDLGVDGIMTDRPETLRDVLIKRGAWVPNDQVG